MCAPVLNLFLFVFIRGNEKENKKARGRDERVRNMLGLSPEKEVKVEAKKEIKEVIYLASPLISAPCPHLISSYTGTTGQGRAGQKESSR
jgi:hypothetical protein